MEGEKEEILCRKRLQELAQSSFYRNYPTYSSFLTLNEQSILETMKQSLPSVAYTLWGGHAMAERRMVCFSNESIEEEQFPIIALEIRPTHLKFAENLSHRDYLGAILNLGIDRSKIGDLILEEHKAYVYVDESMQDYICSSLEKVKHTNITCQAIDRTITIQPKFQEIQGTVQSVRLDSVIALAFHKSRNQMLPLISSGKVFVNGRITEYNSYQLREGDVVSVRGMGKFLYVEQQDFTKKGKQKILLRKYV